MWFFTKKRGKKGLSDNLISEIKSEKYDLNDLFSNINKRSEINALYKELCVMCHPDKYEKDPEKLIIAKNLFNQLQENRNNFNKLIALKAIIEEQL